jgi:SAM-dependent methyltransferase
MRLRDSGMPEENYWEALFDVPGTLAALRINSRLQDVVECGCGYGTFTVPVARAVAGTVYAFDIDPVMVERTRNRSSYLRVVCLVRDVMEKGFVFRSVDAALLFNILHCEEPVALLNHAADAVRPGGHVLVTHWHYGETPRGPSLDIRPRREQIISWADETRLRLEGGIIDLPPWHYGLRFRVV